MTTERTMQQKIDHLTEFSDSRNIKKDFIVQFTKAKQDYNYDYVMANMNGYDKNFELRRYLKLTTPKE